MTSASRPAPTPDPTRPTDAPPDPALPHGHAAASVTVHLLSGPGAGRRATFAQSPITFGRDADNTLVLVDKHASRRHGEIVLVGGHWHLANLGPNGTRLGGRKVADKPVAIRSGDVVSIGDEPVFQLAIESAAPGPSADAARVAALPMSSEAVKAREQRRKTLLWAGIGVYMLLMLALAVFLKTMGKPAEPYAALPAQWTDEHVEAEVRRTVTVPGDKNDFEAEVQLKRAEQLFSAQENSLKARHDAHRAYMLALAYSRKASFEGETELHFQETRKELLKKIKEHYTGGYNMLASGRFDEGNKQLDYIDKAFQNADRDGKFAGHVDGLKLFALRKIEEKKKKKG